MPSYARSTIRTKVNDKVKGSLSTTQLDRIVNDTAREVWNDVDFRSARRRAPLTIDRFNTVYQESVTGVQPSGTRTDIVAEAVKYRFHCPSDLKGNAIVDIRRHHGRTIGSQYRLVGGEEFDVLKTSRDNLIAFDEAEFARSLLFSGLSTLETQIININDTATGNGTWTASTDANSVATETSNYVEGAGAVTFNTDTGATTAVMTNSDMTAVDLTDYDDAAIYVWVYIPATSGLTSFTLRWGNDASNYFSRTVTRTHDNVALFTGWNLLRFPWADATETGTVTLTAIDYLVLTITKTAGMAAANGWIMDAVWAQEDSLHDVLYYTKFPWQTSAGVYLLEASADGDLLNADETEVDLVVLKCSEKVSDLMGDSNGEKKYRDLYNLGVQEYGERYPSEALLLETEAYGLNSLVGPLTGETDDD